MKKLKELLKSTKKHYNKQDINYIKSLTNDIDEVNHDCKSLCREYWIEFNDKYDESLSPENLGGDLKYLKFSIKYKYFNNDDEYMLVSELSIKELDLSIYVLSECINVELEKNKGQS